MEAFPGEQVSPVACRSFSHEGRGDDVRSEEAAEDHRVQGKGKGGLVTKNRR
jgi:hypothetical protein